MNYKNLLAITLFAVSFVTTAFSQVGHHDPLLVVLSPCIAQQERADFYNSFVHLCMENLSPGDRVVIYDGSNMHLMANFTVPANAKSPKVKVKAFTPLWNAVANFLKPSDAPKTVQTPQFLNNVMQVFPGTKPRILIVGSPVYTDKNGKYDMTKGWLSDGYLNVAPTESIFSIQGKSNLLSGSKVYYCYLSDDYFDPTNDKEAHKSKTQSFWGKYVSGLGGKLVVFLPNLKDVFPLWGQGSDGDVQHEAINQADKTLSITIPPPPHPKYNFEHPVSLSSDSLFASGSAELKSEAVAALQDLAQKMGQDKSQTYRINGYTDSHGGESYNQRLSLKRAEAVKTWLVQKGGFDPSKIQTYGLGKSSPKVPPGSSDSESPNRRVEISSVKQ